MFSAKLNDGLLFKKIIDSIKDIVSTIILEISPLGIYLQDMHSSRVMLYDVKLNPEGFEEYKCDKTFNLGITISSLEKVLNDLETGDTLTLSYKKLEPNIKIEIENTNKMKNFDFEIPLNNLWKEKFAFFNSLDTKITMPSSEFRRICKELSAASNEVHIKIDKNYAKFYIDDENNGRAFTIESNPSLNYRIENKSMLNLTFSLQFLNMFNNASSNFESVDLFLGPSSPLTVEYKLGEVGILKFYLAPIVK